ncbi:hypothetical protein FRB98_003744, partial [Tulasnella sp. 332]
VAEIRFKFQNDAEVLVPPELRLAVGDTSCSAVSSVERIEIESRSHVGVCGISPLPGALGSGAEGKGPDGGASIFGIFANRLRDDNADSDAEPPL